MITKEGMMILSSKGATVPAVHSWKECNSCLWGTGKNYIVERKGWRQGGIKDDRERS